MSQRPSTARCSEPLSAALGRVRLGLHRAAEDKTKIVDRTFAGRVSPLVLNFLRVVAQHERLDLVREIAHSAREQYAQMRGLVRVEVSTAAPLSEQLAAKIKEQLRRA